MTIITSMLPTKLQYVYDCIQNNELDHASKISYDQFTKLLFQLHLLPNNNNDNIDNIDSDFLHHIFSTYQQIEQHKNNNNNNNNNAGYNEGEYWLSLLSKTNNGSIINSERFIKAITNCNIESMTQSPVRITSPRSGFSSKVLRNDLLSPRSSLANIINITKTKSYDKSIDDDDDDDDELIKLNEIATDSDLDDDEFNVLKKLPTWNKLKLSVYERRQRWRRKQKTIQRVKQQQVEQENNKRKEEEEMVKALEIAAQKKRQELYEKNKNKNIINNTYSDLDFSSTDDDDHDIIKGPSPPPRKIMSAELKAMCGNLINELISSPRSFYFRDYFPFNKWDLNDYHDYFPKNYNHLNIIKNKLENDEYETPGLFASDVRIIFQCATLYHWEGAKQYRIKAKAMLLSDEFEEKYMDVLAEDEVSQKIRQELIQSMQQREENKQREEKNEYNLIDNDTENDYSGSDGDIDCSSSDEDEYSLSVISTTNLTYDQPSIHHESSITMNGIPEQKKTDDTDNDEISEMMKKLQQLTEFTDVQTMKETNDYIHEIRLDLMIAQKISKESPRLQKMRFLKQLHASQLLMENKQRDMISYRTFDSAVFDDHMTLNNASITTTNKLIKNYPVLVRKNTLFPDEHYNQSNNAWNTRQFNMNNNSITSRGSHTFLRAHDLSIRYAVNFPQSITIKASKRKDDIQCAALSRTGSHDSLHDEPLNEAENEDDTETEFEELPTEMTDEKLIEEHTDDLWAAMPLVPAEILEKAISCDGTTFIESDNVVFDNFNDAQMLLHDECFNYTYNYVKTQFMTHFGKLRVGRDIFVWKLHHIFDAHKEFKWIRLHLKNYYVTPNSIIPIENEKRNKLYGLLQILQPQKTQNISPIHIIYQHKLYLYELLKLSGVIRIEQSPPIPINQYDDFILSLDELWLNTKSDDDDEYKDCDDNDNYSDDDNDTDNDLRGLLNENNENNPILPSIKTKSKPGSTPTVNNNQNSFQSFLDEFRSNDNHENLIINNADIINADFNKTIHELSKQFVVAMTDSESEEDEVFIIPTQNVTDYAHQTAMNEDYAGNHHHQNGNTQNGSGNNNNNNNNDDEQNTNDDGDNPWNNSDGGGDGGDEKKNNDDNNNNNNNDIIEDAPDNDDENKEEDEKEEDNNIGIAQQEEFGNIQQDIEVVDAPLNDDDEDRNRRTSRIANIIKGLGTIFAVIVAIIFGTDFISMDQERDSMELSGFYQAAQNFLNVYDAELIARERHSDYEPYTVEIAEDNPSQTWLNGLHIGSLVDALDIENKWYTGYVTNIDIKTGNVKIHYDDWSERFDEWIDPSSGKLAPYRTHAIGGRFQGGLPGRVTLPIKPRNNSVLSAFNKMKLQFLKQQKTIPDITIRILDINDMGEYKDLLLPIFYEMGIIYNNRAVYMNHHKIYIFYSNNEWCVGPKYNNKQNAIICIKSNALRPELIVETEEKLLFKKAVFSPAYLSSRITKNKYAEIGAKGLENIPRITLNNKVMLPMVIVGTAGIPFEQRSNIIYNAAKLGYYMFDTGTQTMSKPIYFNHKYINDLFKVYGRSTIGVSTKIPSYLHGYHSTFNNFISQLNTLGTDYIDLVLIEHPDCIKDREIKQCEGHWLDTWRALEHLYEKKRIRALGVSQFNVHHLNFLMQYKQKHIPLSVVRDWRDPLFQNNNILKWCETNNVHFEAFSALGGQQLIKRNDNPIFKNPTITRIAARNKMKASQVIIKWNILHNIGVIIRTSDTEHLLENLNTFEINKKLTDKDIYDIDKMNNKGQQHHNPQKEEIRFEIPRNPNNPHHNNIIDGEKKKKKKRYRNQDNDEESVELQDDL